MEIVVILAFAVGGTLAVIYREKLSTLLSPKSNVPTTMAEAIIPATPTPGVWRLEFNPTTTKLDGPTTFLFGQPHYFVKSPDQKIATGQRIDVTFRLDGVGTLTPTEGAKDEPRAYVRLYFQRKGDNLSGQGDYEFYRWWAGQSMVDISHSPGTFTISETIQPDRWTSVYAKPGDAVPDKFMAAVADVDAIGLTFGGNFAGHGVMPAPGTADGAVRFTLVGFNIT